MSDLSSAENAIDKAFSRYTAALYRVERSQSPEDYLMARSAYWKWAGLYLTPEELEALKGSGAASRWMPT